jgi:hypothetical protein
MSLENMSVQDLEMSWRAGVCLDIDESTANRRGMYIFYMRMAPLEIATATGKVEQWQTN